MIAGSQATAIGVRASAREPTRIDVDNSLVVVDRTVLLNPEANSGVSLQLRRVAVLTGGLLDVDEIGPVEGISIALQDAAIDRSGGAMIRVNQSHAGALLRALRWTGSNLVYAGSGPFVINRRRFTLDDESTWNEALQLTTNSHRHLDRGLFPSNLVRSASNLFPADLDPAVLGAAAGFVPENVGAREAYDRFRNSPAYRDWKRKVQQAAAEWERKRGLESGRSN